MSDIKNSYVKSLKGWPLGPWGGNQEKKMSKGGEVCAHCGGQVDALGFAQGGEVEAPDEKPVPKEETRAQRLYAAALRMKKGGR